MSWNSHHLQSVQCTSSCTGPTPAWNDKQWESPDSEWFSFHILFSPKGALYIECGLENPGERQCLRQEICERILGKLEYQTIIFLASF